jgi:HPr kinase/phosphorylase
MNANFDENQVITGESAALHASCIVLGEAGILIQGESGSGKSTLARSLMTRAHQEGIFAILVGDDRVIVHVQHGRAVARPYPAIAGLMEIRGFGLVKCAYEPSCVIKVVIICKNEYPSRMPTLSESKVNIAGIDLPCLFWRPSNGIEDTFMCLKSNYLAHIMTE